MSSNRPESFFTFLRNRFAARSRAKTASRTARHASARGTAMLVMRHNGAHESAAGQPRQGRARLSDAFHPSIRTLPSAALAA
jgi:hypothetical protein